MLSSKPNTELHVFVLSLFTDVYVHSIFSGCSASIDFSFQSSLSVIVAVVQMSYHGQAFQIFNYILSIWDVLEVTDPNITTDSIQFTYRDFECLSRPMFIVKSKAFCPHVDLALYQQYENKIHACTFALTITIHGDTNKSNIYTGNVHVILKNSRQYLSTPLKFCTDYVQKGKTLWVKMVFHGLSENHSTSCKC